MQLTELIKMKKYLLLAMLLSSILKLFCARSDETKLISATTQVKQECSICYENIIFNEQKRMLTCSHIFHERCINEWFSEPISQAKCPLCRDCDNNELKMIYEPKLRNIFFKWLTTTSSIIIFILLLNIGFEKIKESSN